MKSVAAQWLSPCWNSSGDDETFQDIFRDFSDMASHDPERLSRRQFSRGGDEEEEEEKWWTANTVLKRCQNDKDWKPVGLQATLGYHANILNGHFNISKNADHMSV